jgi:hypothetical protein
MTTNASSDAERSAGVARTRGRRPGQGSGGFAYLLGFIGALVYFVQTSDGFWPTVLGVLQAFVWPAFLVYDVLKFVAA